MISTPRRSFHKPEVAIKTLITKGIDDVKPGDRFKILRTFLGLNTGKKNERQTFSVCYKTVCSEYLIKQNMKNNCLAIRNVDMESVWKTNI